MASPNDSIPSSDVLLLIAQKRAEDEIDERRVLGGKPKIIVQPLAPSIPPPLNPNEAILVERMYPFTRGMNLINDGVGYGERVKETTGRISRKNGGNPVLAIDDKVITLRTRTGKLTLPLPGNAAKGRP